MSKTDSEQFLDDVIITAVEGGINYWAWVDDYQWSDDGPTSVLVIDRDEMRCEACAAIITDGRGVPEQFPYFLTEEETAAADRAIETGKPYAGPRADHDHVPAGVLVDRARILGALDVIRDPGRDLKWNDASRRRVIGAWALNDASDIDAEDADCIVQIALFGEVVYG